MPTSPARSWKRTLFLAWAASCFCQTELAPAWAAAIDVGVGPGCEASTLAAALDLADDTPEADEIRLRDEAVYSSTETVRLTDWDPATKGTLTLRGGYGASCFNTSPEEFGSSRLENSGSGAILQVDTVGASSSQVTLDNLVIRAASGRGLVVEGNGSVMISDSFVLDNTGGGVAVSGGASFTMANTNVSNNVATFGAGIFCTGAGSEVDLQGNITFNEATNGGGLAVTDGCEALLGPDLDFRNNEALTGAGFFADSGALVSGLDGDIGIDSNEATVNGGGFAATGSGTQVLLAGVVLDENQAGFRGGGIFADDSAFVALGAHGDPCFSLFTAMTFLNCPSQLSRLALTSGSGDGAAVAALGGAEIRLLQTAVTRSSFPREDPGGSILYASGAGSRIRAEGVLVDSGLSVTSAFHAENGADLHISMTTVTGNTFDFPDQLSEGIRLEGAGTEAQVYSSIFHPVAGYLATSGASFSAIDCLITSSTDGLTGGTFVIETDPMFNQPPVDFRLVRGSPAVDFCDDDLFAPTVPGLGGVERGIDDPLDPNGDPGVPNPTAFFDLGAFPLGLIFSDGFEIGSFSRWSDVQTGSAPPEPPNGPSH